MYSRIFQGDNEQQAISDQQSILDKSDSSQSYSVGSGSDILDSIILETGFARMARLRQELLFLGLSQSLEVLEHSKNVSSKVERQKIQNEIVRRIASIDPPHALSISREFPWNQQKVLTNVVMIEWAFKDLDSLVSSSSDFNEIEKQSAVKAMLYSTENWSLQDRLKLAQDLDNLEIALDLLEDTFVSNSAENPEESWKAIVNDSRPNLNQLSSLMLIAETWIARDGLEVLRELADLLPKGRERSRVLSSIMQQIGETRPFEVLLFADELQGFSNAFTVLGPIASACAKSDPIAALNSIEDLDSTILRRQIYQSILQEWISNEPRVVLESLDDLPNEVRGTGKKQALMSLASLSPKEASAWLPELEDEFAYDVGFAIITQWSNIDLNEALNWVVTEKIDQELRNYLLEFLWEPLTKHDREIAFHTALELPSARHEVGPEALVLKYIARTDALYARSLLNKVRDGFTKNAAYVEVGNALVKQGEIDSVFDLGTELSELAHLSYHGSVASEWAYHDPVEMFESIDRFPTPETKSRAAFWLISSNDSFKKLTRAQIEQLESYLSQVDQEALKVSIP